MEKFWVVLEVSIDIDVNDLEYLNFADRKQFLKIRYISTVKEGAERFILNAQENPLIGNLILLEAMGEGNFDFRNGKGKKPFIWIEPLEE